jgi:hypothetical protein
VSKSARWVLLITIIWVLLSTSGVLSGSWAIGGDPSEPIDITSVK